MRTLPLRLRVLLHQLRESSLPRRVVAEALGTALLLVAVVGSGIAAQRLKSSGVVVVPYGSSAEEASV